MAAVAACWHGRRMHAHRTSLLCLSAMLAASGIAASVPAGASAATQRYAGPKGSGSDCTSAQPCDLFYALEHSNSGDEVIVAPGDYPRSLEDLRVYSGVTVHGVPGKARPRLLFHNMPTPSLQVLGTLRDVEVIQAPSDQGIALGLDGGSLDQVSVRGSAQDGWPAVMNRNGVIRNSIVVSPSDHGEAIFTHAANDFETGTFRNVTAIATGNGGVGIRVRATSQGAFANVLVKNAIARGGPSGDDVRAETDNTATAKITIGNSNWADSDTWLAGASIADAGGNQSAAPAFVDAVSGNYHEAAGSPTIGAGLDEFVDGPLDIDGDPRELFGIDIGADEFVVAPAATTGAASAVTDRSAKLGGSVNANGTPTKYHFEYGPTTAYGSVTPAVSAGSGGVVTGAATVSALSATTKYHYRLVASNRGGATKGADRTFTTASAPKPAPIPTPPGPSSPSTIPTPTGGVFAGVEPASTRLTYRHGFITLRLSCAARTVGGCTGRARLKALRRGVTLGRARFSLAAGTVAKTRVRVTRAGRHLLGHKRRLRAKDINAARDGAGAAKTTRTAVTIRRRHR
jgi:hypothetical protein